MMITMMNQSQEGDFEWTGFFFSPGKAALQFSHSFQSHKFDLVPDQISAPGRCVPLQ